MRLSAGISEIDVHGMTKAQAVHDMIQGPDTPRCPASILQLHPNVTVFADDAAASLLCPG